jgi:predicted heme/steroid binding protein/uncharacterized membrane protein
MKEFDANSFSDFDGKDGRPVYIAYQGKVYDVSQSAMWKGGQHMKRHSAGLDLASEFPAAPHGEEVFERYPQVGILKQKTESARPMPAFLSSLIERLPFLERHPHPMTVHFPIVFILSVFFFDALYLLSGVDSFKNTAFHCLIGGILFMPVAMLTGFFTWWLNYMAKPMKPIKCKIIMSVILLTVAIGALLWRIFEPRLLESYGIERIIYLIIILSFVPLVSGIGWLGASLTFPIKRK